MSYLNPDVNATTNSFVTLETLASPSHVKKHIRNLNGGLDGSYGGTHPIKKTPDQGSMVPAMSLVEDTISKRSHSNV